MHNSYFLGTLDRLTINDKYSLSETQFYYLKGFIDAIENFSNHEDLFKIVELNYNDLTAKIEYYLSTSNGSLKGDFYEFRNIFLDINRHLLNVLSSIRTFLDHTEAMLKREYGEQSEEYKFFSKETSSAYDSNFEYRFLYKLRNYAQHCGLPSGSAKINSTETGNSFYLYFVRDELLARYTGWGIVKKDIERCFSEFDVINIVNKVIELLKDIHKNLYDKLISHYKRQGKELLDLILKVQKIKGMPCLIKMVPKETETDCTFYYFPLEHISRLTGVEIKILEV